MGPTNSCSAEVVDGLETECDGVVRQGSSLDLQLMEKQLSNCPSGNDIVMPSLLA